MFLGAYRTFFDETDKNLVLSQTSPESVIKTIFGLTKTKINAPKIYLLIDEYDHFANELLSFDLDRFKSDVSRNGFVRKFYETFKTATGDGIVDRIFITGVSPVTLDSLTSGFNIADNISLNSIFHDMMGFTYAETEAILRKSDIPEDTIPNMMSDLREWYDGYQFTRVNNGALFNPDMLLYFLKEYSIANRYPDDMLDMNIVSDYRKIRNMFKIGGEEDIRLEILDRLVKDGAVEFPLTRLFNLEEPLTDDDFLSLLFYMGLLTFEEAMSSDWRYKIPNYVIKKLYFEYFAANNLRKTQFSRSMSPITQTINALMNEANPEAFLKIVEHVLQENHSNRDEMQFGEKHLKTLIIALLFPYKAFKIHSEYESKRGYPDIFLERIPDRKINFEVVIELKYVKKSAAETVESVVAEAKTQVEKYMKTERFTRPDVQGFYIVFLGGTVYEWGKAVK
jgi:hypothetical protein